MRASIAVSSGSKYANDLKKQLKERARERFHGLLTKIKLFSLRLRLSSRDAKTLKKFVRLNSSSQGKAQPSACLTLVEQRDLKSQIT